MVWWHLVLQCERAGVPCRSFDGVSHRSGIQLASVVKVATVNCVMCKLFNYLLISLKSSGMLLS